MSQEILGSSGSSSGSQNSQSGFALLPPSIQAAFNQYAGTLNGVTGDNSAMTSAFTPQDLNSGSASSLSALSSNAYAPTAANINSSLTEQMNPYNQDVINQINTNAMGAGSVLNSQLSAAGQFGSNRAALGANDIGIQQANEIGSLLNPEFNTAMTNALTTIPQAFQTSAAGSVNAGLTQQQQALAKSTAPYTALSAYSSLLGNIPQSGGSVSNGTNSSATGSGFGMFGML